MSLPSHYQSWVEDLYEDALAYGLSEADAKDYVQWRKEQEGIGLDSVSAISYYVDLTGVNDNAQAK
tara:strand:+ start:242 stop:439 length:198 start_codon:yes stop_codon:yes gene_type:complete